jgi:hypothetical protein
LKEDAKSPTRESHSQGRDLAVTFTLFAAALFTCNIAAVKEPILSMTNYLYSEIKGFEGRVNT